MKENEHDCKIGGINYDLCYTDDDTMITECSDELQALVIKVKSKMKKGLKLNIKKIKEMTEEQLVLELILVWTGR